MEVVVRVFDTESTETASHKHVQYRQGDSSVDFYNEYLTLPKLSLRLGLSSL
jgi:hypothetical protein